MNELITHIFAILTTFADLILIKQTITKLSMENLQNFSFYF